MWSGHKIVYSKCKAKVAIYGDVWIRLINKLSTDTLDFCFCFGKCPPYPYQCHKSSAWNLHLFLFLIRIRLVSSLLRGLGAFFIKRKIDPVAGKKDIVYRAVLHTYMQHALSAGHNVEFFIEGGRTRTGKPCMPKSGVLSGKQYDAITELNGKPFICISSFHFQWSLMRWMLTQSAMHCLCRYQWTMSVCAMEISCTSNWAKERSRKNLPQRWLPFGKHWIQSTVKFELISMSHSHSVNWSKRTRNRWAKPLATHLQKWNMQIMHGWNINRQHLRCMAPMWSMKSIGLLSTALHVTWSMIVLLLPHAWQPMRLHFYY